MTMFEVYLNLIRLYKKSQEDNSPFFENLVGNIRISVTHKQALVLDTSNKTVICMLLDTSAYCGVLKHQFIFSGRENSATVEISGLGGTSITISKMLPKYLEPGTVIEEEVWDVNDITEDYHFQQSTIVDIPEYKYFEQVKKYFKDISGAGQIWQTSALMNINHDWDNIPLREEDFL